MKRLFLSMLTVLFLSSMAFAGNLYDPSAVNPAVVTPAVTKSAVKPAEMQARMLTGTVKAIAPGDPAKGINGELTVVSDNGAKTIFVLSPMAATALSKGEKVKVKYQSMQNGNNKAIDVMVIK